MVLLLPVLIILLVTAVRALAHDGMNDAWMRSLERPDVGGSCCNTTDCRVTRARVGADGWEALNQFGVWVKVANAKIVRGKGNPTGEPVLCWLPSPGVLCFVEPPAA